MTVIMVHRNDVLYLSVHLIRETRCQDVGCSIIHIHVMVFDFFSLMYFLCLGKGKELSITSDTTDGHVYSQKNRMDEKFIINQTRSHSTTVSTSSTVRKTNCSQLQKKRTQFVTENNWNPLFITNSSLVLFTSQFDGLSDVTSLASTSSIKRRYVFVPPRDQSPAFDDTLTPAASSVQINQYQ